MIYFKFCKERRGKLACYLDNLEAQLQRQLPLNERVRVCIRWVHVCVLVCEGLCMQNAFQRICIILYSTRNI